MKKQYIHFVGIKGVGMTPLAIIAKEAGCKVTGTDVSDEFITDSLLKKAGISVQLGFMEEHIQHPDVVITTGAHGGYENIEVKTAHKLGIPILSQGEAVGALMNGTLLGKKYKGISISGTHGKTTTTAMLATVLMQNKYDPMYLVGSGNIGSLGLPGHYGKGSYFIAEADEYATEPVSDKRAKFLWQEPSIAVITNIEYDHPDIYPSLESVQTAFLRFCSNIKPDGVLIACGDDRQVQTLLKQYKGRKITYGFNQSCNYFISRVTVSGNQTFFWVTGYGTPLGEFVLRVSGEHNALNALAVIIVSLEVGIGLPSIKKSLALFQGSKRRLEYIGKTNLGALLYDDYAHHPTEIEKTLGTLRKMYPKKQLVCIFQPHTFSRTKALFNNFVTAFKDADAVIITDIYASLREKPDATVSSHMLSFAIAQSHKDIVYIPKLSDVIEYVNKSRYRTDTVLITMGAGDIYTIHANISIV